MGTMATPYDDVRIAKEFAKKMKKPWTAYVMVDWDCDVSLFIEDDEFHEMMHSKASSSRMDFDVRPLLIKRLTTWMKEEERCYKETGVFNTRGTTVEAVNVIRELLGMQPLAMTELAKQAAKRTGSKSSIRKPARKKAQVRKATKRPAKRPAKRKG